MGHYIRLLEGIRPKWFVMENVEGLLTNAGGLHVRDTVAAFLEAGYWLNLEKVYAQGYGVPQRRKRVLIVGNRLGQNFLFPEPVTRFSGSLFRKGEITFATAVSDLPLATKEAGEPLMFREPPRNELQAYLVFPIDRATGATPDPGDEMILECAAAAAADFIVSGDKKHLLALRQFQGIPIVSPAELFESMFT